MQPLISVVIPTFNPGAKLAVSLGSLATVPSDIMERIVIDGCSDDGTIEMLEASKSADLWFSQKDSGIYDAMNKGIGVARGRYLYFLGAGDRFRPDALPKMIGAMNDTVPQLIYGDVRYADTGRIYGGPFNEARMRTGHNISHQAIFYSKSIFDRLGGFRLSYPIVADFEFNMRCMADRSIAKVHVPVTVADFEGGGESDSRRDEAFMRDYPKLIRRYFGLKHYALYRLRMGIPDQIKRIARGFAGSRD